MDEVGNKSQVYTLGPVTFDNVAPSIITYADGPESYAGVKLFDDDDNCYTNKTTLNIKFRYEDLGFGASAESGVVKAVISGTDILTQTIELDPQ
jgi:hypothetical protein